MSLLARVGTILARTTTGSQAYTGIGFLPKALILYCVNRASTPGVNTGIAAFGYGFSSASASRACAVTSRNAGTTTANIDEESRMAAAAITMLNTFGSTHLEATLTSFDADGFTLNFTAVTGSANVIGYIALGGTDITNVSVGDFLTGTSTGNVDVTAPGFLPDATFLMHTNLGTALPYTSRTGSRFGFGVGVSASERWASMRMVRDQILNTSAHSKQVASAVLLGMDTSGAEDFVGDYSGPITGGFRVNLSDAPASTVRVAYMAIEGPTFSAGLETQPTSAGNKDTTVAGTPKVAGFGGCAKTAGTTIDTATDAMSIFGASDFTNEVGVAVRTADNVATADVLGELTTTKAMIRSNIAGTTTLAECDASIPSAGTLRLNWTTADAVANQFGWWTAGDGATAHVVSIGQVTETATAQAVTRSKRKAIGQVSLTATAQAVTHTKRRAVGQVTETATAQTLAARLKRKAVGQVTETATAQAVTRRKAKALGQVAETASALAITRRKTRLLGQVTETDTAGAVSYLGPKVVAIGQVTATDAALAVARRKAKAVGQVTETGTAQAVARRKARAIGQVTETGTAQAVAWRPKRRLIGTVSQTMTAQAVSRLKRKALGQVAETGTAQALTEVKRRTLGQVAETHTARPVALSPLRALVGTATETLSALAVSTQVVLVPFVAPARARVESRRPLLAVRLRGPGRTWTVLGVDDARGVAAEGFTCSVDRAGPTSAGFKVRVDPGRLHPDLDAFSEVDAEVGGVPIFGGRLWSAPGDRNSERSLTVQAVGMQSHLDDDALRRLYVRDSLSGFVDARSRPITNLSNHRAAPRVETDDAAITLIFPTGFAVVTGDFAAATLDLGSSIGRRFIVTWERVGLADTDDTLYLRPSASSDDQVGGDDTTTNLSGTGGTLSVTAAADRRYVHLILYRNGAGGTFGQDQGVRITRVKIFGETAFESGGSSVLRASTVVRDVLTSGALPLLSGDTSRITTSDLIDAGVRGIPHLEFPGYVGPRQILDAANAYHGWNLGVDALRRLFFEPRAAQPVVEVGEWSGAEFSDQSNASAETRYNRVIVEGRDASGDPVSVTVTAAVPALDSLGITRTKVLAVSATLNTASATVIGEAWLIENARSQFRGSLRVVGMGAIREVQTGRPVHPFEVLALHGKMIRFTNLVDPDSGGWGRDGIIDSATYDHDAEAVSIGIDNTNGRLTALLERVGALQAVTR